LQPAGLAERRQAPAAQHSRAAAVAEAVARIQRQETALAGAAATSGAAGRTPGATSLRDMPAGAPTPLGQTHRRTRSRVSASATRRDYGK
ncbi:hypothetical protein ACCC88_23005, partial [Sphingomonas sp. Sphisp140]